MTTRGALLFSFFSLTVVLQAGTLEVGEGKQYSTIAAAAAAVQPGDTVLIFPGIYREAVRWRISGLEGEPITVRGVEGARPIIDGTGVVISGSGQVGRALFQVEANDYIFENLELRNGRNNQNGAGFRMLNSRRTVIRNVKVMWNDMGIVSVGNDELLVEYSEIAYNGTPLYNGYSHNFYLEGDRSTVRHCYIHDSTNGQTFKTRGRYTELLYNYIADAHDRIQGGDTTKEIGIQGGDDTEAPNSHALLLGNIIIKRGSGYSFLDFGPENVRPFRNGTLFLINNTLVREGKPAGWLLRLGHPSGRAVLYNNIISGVPELARGAGAAMLEGSNNWLPNGVAAPPGLRQTIHGDDPGFVSPAQRNYRLRPQSPCLRKGAERLSALDGQGAPRPVAATEEYSAPWNHAPRPGRERISIGALEQ
jgi:Right handed beta helix region